MSISITRILKVGENERVEFKQSLSERKQILEAISAFSNSKGGTVVIGIHPNNKVHGVTIGANTLENLSNEIKQNTDPTIFPSIEIASIGSKRLIVIHVQEYPVKPVWTSDRVFLRVGRTNQRASAEKIRQMIQRAQPYRWDQHTPRGSKLSDIDSSRIRAFYKAVEEERSALIVGSKSLTAVLAKLHLLNEKKPNAAAILLFGMNPQSYFVQSQVRCARFKGRDTDEFLDLKVFEDTIIEQVPSILEFIERHLRVSAKVTGKAQRSEAWEIPKEAIREAVINAICHRDYEDTGNVQVRIFDDRIEIWNPGILPEGLSIESLRGEHRSQPRNNLIANCFYRLKYIEQWGTGTNRMIRLCKRSGVPEPSFRQEHGSFVVTFKRVVSHATNTATKMKLSKTQLSILQYLKKHGGASTSELVEFLQISDRAIRKNIESMSHLLHWTGASANDPTGKYELLERTLIDPSSSE